MTTTPGPVNLADHAALARAALDENAWAYFSGGAADEITLHANKSAWDGMRLLPRVLRGTAGGDTRVTLLGRMLEHPVLLAPVAYQCLAHPDGELASAMAAAALGAGVVLGTQASVSLEAVARCVLGDGGRGPLWFQLYWQPDRQSTKKLVARAEAAGFEALVLTVDAPVHGARDRERRAGFQLPPGVGAVNLSAMPTAPPAELPRGASRLFHDLLLAAPTWEDVAWLQKQTRLPIVLKGILHPDDARHACELGVAGLIVSNHGGRTLDTAIATAHALPAVIRAVQGAMPVLVDGGIRRGTDILKAMALGAAAVLIGRPYVFGLAHAGAHGVAHVLRLLRDELEISMALTGCRSLADATSLNK